MQLRSGVVKGVRKSAAGQDKKLQRVSGIERSAQDTEPVVSPLDISEAWWSLNDTENLDRLSKQGFSSWRKYHTTHELADLDFTIQCFRQSLPCFFSANQFAMFMSLGAAYDERYEASHALVDLETSLEFYHEALEGVPDEGEKEAMILRGLGAAYGALFQETHDLNDLETSIMYHKLELDFVPQDEANEMGYTASVHRLAAAYGYRYDRTKSLADLDDFVTHMRKAYRVVPLKNGVHRATILGQLGWALILRFVHTFQSPDWREGIRCHQQAIEDIPVGDEMREPFVSRLEALSKCS